MIETPKHYRDFLAKYGGLNPLGEPAFLLHWGSDPIRRVGLAEQYLMPFPFMAPYIGCWVLAEWNPPEEFGHPDTWDDYPFNVSRGAYLPVQIFREEGKPVMLDSQWLNLNVLGLWLKVILNHKYDSMQKRRTTIETEHEQKELAKMKGLVDQIEDGAPAFLEAASFHGQQNCNTVVKQKMEKLEQMMPQLRSVSRRWPRGMTTVQPKGELWQ